MFMTTALVQTYRKLMEDITYFNELRLFFNSVLYPSMAVTQVPVLLT